MSKAAPNDASKHYENPRLKTLSIFRNEKRRIWFFHAQNQLYPRAILVRFNLRQRRHRLRHSLAVLMNINAQSQARRRMPHQRLSGFDR